MKGLLKAFAGRLARSGITRRMVEHLIYPSVVECLGSEIRTGRVSPSGFVEQLSWKLHSYVVLSEELFPTGQDCSAALMRSDSETRARMIDVVLDHCSEIQGDILEFGVYQGQSLELFAERSPHRHVYGFDSFEGLPEDWWKKPKGTFKTEPPCIKSPNVTLVKGLFKHTLPSFVKEWSSQACLVHVDCVLYHSTLDCLLPLLPRCQRGTVILFDEYYNYDGFAKHEWLAWREIRARYKVRAQCIAYDGKRAAFKITDLGDLESSKLDYLNVVADARPGRRSGATSA